MLVVVLKRHGTTVPPDNLLHLYERHRDGNPKPVRRDRLADPRGVDELQALHAGAVRPPDGKSAGPEGPDGDVRGSRGSSIRQALYNTP